MRKYYQQDEAKHQKVPWSHNYRHQYRLLLQNRMEDDEQLDGLQFDYCRKLRVVMSISEFLFGLILNVILQVQQSIETTTKTRYPTRYSTRLAGVSVTEESTITATHRRTSRFTSE